MRFAGLWCWILVQMGLPAQESIPLPAPTTVGRLSTDESGPVIGSLLIPAVLISREASEEIHYRTPVDRVILGTRSRGTAICTGQVVCRTGQLPHGVELHCQLSGQVRSATCGVNGPALIQSTAVTEFHGEKIIVFDGQQLTVSPVQLAGTTRITLNHIGSSAPRIRGRIVSRIATRQAIPSLPRAEAITHNLTLTELRQGIDAEFQQRLRSLNSKLRLWLSILDGVGNNEFVVNIHSHSEYIEVLLRKSGTAATAASRAAPVLPVGERVVLWLPLLAIDLGEVFDWETMDLRDMADAVPLWLATSLANRQQEPAGLASRLELIRHGDWIGFQFKPLADE